MRTETLRNSGRELRYPRYRRASLIEPAGSGYLHLAAEVDSRPPFLRNSGNKRALVADLKERCGRLEQTPRVLGATVFDALLIPPGRGRFLRERAGVVHVARFDLAVLVETRDSEAADAVRPSSAYAEMERAVREASSFTHSIIATNVRRIGPVDHGRDGVFLFNYFFADDTDRNLAVWEHTAGWFEKETGLDHSTVLLPQNGERSEYDIINHCRWDRLRDVLPSLILKRAFRSYVLAGFQANNVAAMPVLYRLARGPRPGGIPEPRGGARRRARARTPRRSDS